MKYLLDINVLLAAIWRNHSSHTKAEAWIAGKSLAVCPLSELGFLRISTHAKGPFRAGMKDARSLLSDFLAKTRCSFIPADLSGLESFAVESDVVTDNYLAELAGRHGIKFATLDTRIRHEACDFIG